MSRSIIDDIEVYHNPAEDLSEKPYKCQDLSEKPYKCHRHQIKHAPGTYEVRTEPGSMNYVETDHTIKLDYARIEKKMEEYIRTSSTIDGAWQKMKEYCENDVPSRIAAIGKTAEKAAAQLVLYGSSVVRIHPDHPDDIDPDLWEDCKFLEPRKPRTWPTWADTVMETNEILADLPWREADDAADDTDRKWFTLDIEGRDGDE
jgi:hypothetical protein